MKLVGPKDLITANPQLNYPGGEYFARFLMQMLQFHKPVRIYAGIKDKQGVAFIDELIRVLHLEIEFDRNELERIPANGPAVIVSNHPLGGLDSLLLIMLVSQIRPDVKILSDFSLKKLNPVSEYIIDTNPFDQTSGNGKSAYSGLRESMTFLRKGGILCVFPAGSANTWYASGMESDTIWRYPVIKFIREMHVPVIPVLFQSNNSPIFRILGKLHPVLKNVRLPSELYTKKNKNIRIRIGNMIKQADQDKFSDIYKYGRYLRAKTYGMATPMEIRKFFNNPFKGSIKSGPVIDPVSKEEIKAEILALMPNHLLFRLRDYAVFAAPTRLIPRILTEIGRLREITFRAVGEGTNKSIDIDEFDLYYHQLFIWDEKQECIVGAYRIGTGNEIMEQFGKRGFYLHSLFRMGDSMTEILNQSLELGRSFIIQEYQKKPMPLFLLWKGILYFLLKNHEYRYLIGPVSISNNYSPVSKDLIIRFILTNHYNWPIARKIKPRKAYKFRSINPDINVLMDSTEQDIEKLDKTIGDMDALNSGLPVLLKKYIRLNAKIAGFNVDPKFNNSLDGLIILDTHDIPISFIEGLSKEINDNALTERFHP